MAKNNARAHRVLVTGATDGIGLLLARAYAKRGHQVLATGKRGIANDEEFFKSPNVTYVMADQGDPRHAASTIVAIMQEMGWKDLDVAILNGATAWTGPPYDEPINTIGHQLKVNVASPIHLTLALAPMLFAAKGRLVMVGSTSVNKAQGQFATYVATKAALDGLCRALREEWRGRADVMIVHPGPTRTRMHAKAGLKVGFIRLFFMSPKKVARAIQVMIRRNNEGRKMITRFGCFMARFSWAGKGQL
jgi:short-subunit dehydrogenase